MIRYAAKVSILAFLLISFGTAALAQCNGGTSQVQSSTCNHSQGKDDQPVKEAHHSSHENGKKPGHSHENSQIHGGIVRMTEQHHFETVFDAAGIRVYMYSDQQVPMQIGKANGTAILEFDDGTTKKILLSKRLPQDGDQTAYFCPMHPKATQMAPGECAACGGMKLMAQDYLFSEVDLSGIEPESVKAVIHLEGIAGKESEVTFTETHQGQMHHGETKDHMITHDDSADHEAHHH